jgi:hypothetical protein
MTLDWPAIVKRAKRLYAELERDHPKFTHVAWDKLFPHTRNAIIWRAMTNEEREALHGEAEAK